MYDDPDPPYKDPKDEEGMISEKEADGEVNNFNTLNIKTKN